MAGMFSRGTDAVCQKSVPERSEIFSAMVNWPRTSSTSKSLCVTFGVGLIVEDICSLSVFNTDMVRMDGGPKFPR